MKNISRVVIFIFLGISFGLAQNLNVRLISNVNDHSNDGYTDCWGYTAPNGDDYALIGVNRGISIIDVSDTSNIAEVQFVRWIQFGWYDIKVYKNYMYVSTEGSLDILIVDLSGLPESASVVGTYSELTSTPHNIYIDTTMALLYIVEDFNYDPSVRIVSLADPVNPVELSTINPSINGKDIHDLYARDSVLYIAEGNDPSVGFYDVSDPSNPSLITRLNIPAAGYVHQLWVSKDNDYLVTTEETTDKTVKIWDIHDLDNIELISEYLGGSRLAHNAYIHEDKIYISHYESGLKVLDFSDPFDVVEMGNYDTFPQAETSNFRGAWGVYPFTNNGLIFVSDMQSGLYILNIEQENGPQIVANNIEFGYRKLGETSDTLDFILKNNGTEELFVTAISDLDQPFNLIGVPELPVGIAPNRSLVLGATFSPINEDSTEASITIASNDENDPIVEVIFAGQGIIITPAQSGTIYATLGNSDPNAGSLLNLNPGTGAGTIIAPTNILSSGFGAPGLPALAINSKGDLFVADVDLNAKLYQIDAGTGKSIRIGPTGLALVNSLAFDNNDILYAGDGNGDLHIIDVSSGLSTLIGDMGLNVRGLAFDPTDGALWASDNSNNIFKVDVTTGKGTKVGSTGFSNGTPDISFDGIGNLYGSVGASAEANNLISIDKSDGSGDIIGPIGYSSVSGMATYHESFWMITIKDVKIENYFPKPGSDTLHIVSKIDNPNEYELTVKAIVETYDLSMSDTLLLYDDGNHADSLAGDGIWGGAWPVKSAHGYFSVSVQAFPSELDYLNNFLHHGARFTTAGPVIFEDYVIAFEDTIPNPGDALSFWINIKNESLTDSVVNISTKTTSLDPCASIIAFSNPQYNDIAPGEIAEPSRGIRISFTENCPIQTNIEFALEIYSDGFLFWTDTFSVSLDSVVSSLVQTDEKIPTEYKLHQNYPNPFNPTTTISYQLPKAGEVELSIYNLLGQNVASLISTRQQAGHYNIEWDASDFSSGIYYYRIEVRDPARRTGEFQDVMKMILVR
jgi:choice-of-anchor B domain-containing protein